MFLVGYLSESKNYRLFNYRLFNPHNNKVIVSRDVIFNEKARYDKNENEYDISFNIRLNDYSNEMRMTAMR